MTMRHFSESLGAKIRKSTVLDAWEKEWERERERERERDRALWCL